MRTITVRLPDEAYEAVQQHAEADGTSMNSWVEQVLGQEDMRRRCTAHDRWLRTRPHARALTDQVADLAANAVAGR